MTTLYISQTGDNANGGALSEPLRWYGEAVRRASSDPSITAIHFKRGETHGGGQINIDGLMGVRIGSYGDEEARPAISGGVIIYSRELPIEGLTFDGLMSVGSATGEPERIEDGGFSVLCPKGNGLDIRLIDSAVHGGYIGFYCKGVSGVLAERFVFYDTIKQGVFMSGCHSVVLSTGAVIKCGWRESVVPRDNFRNHGCYFNHDTHGVEIDRVILAHNAFYGLKMERSGHVHDSLLVGHPIHIGAGPDGGGTDELPYNPSDHPLTSYLNVYAAACDITGHNRGRVMAPSQWQIGRAEFRNDVIGAPVTSDGRVIDSPFDKEFWVDGGVVNTPNTRVFGYGVASRTTYEPWEKLDTWEAIARVMLERGVSVDEINASRSTAFNAITGDHPNTEPPLVVTPPEPEPDEPVSGGDSTDTPTQPTPRVTLTAEGGGLYEVFVDGVPRSRHSQVREADQSAINAALADPSAEVYYLYPQSRVRVRVER